jgi:hypothetical protein
MNIRADAVAMNIRTHAKTGILSSTEDLRFQSSPAAQWLAVSLPAVILGLILIGCFANPEWGATVGAALGGLDLVQVAD